ncbi:MAG: 16S rRNA (guanine(966)-N(2))-methyltransferase RsmD [Actinomycetota bacterium]
MRVTGGEAKGRTLRSTRAPEMRPTTDMARKTIFDILQGVVAERRVLDLFAGTGALAIEALSRGARGAVLVDSDRTACAVIERNLEATGYTGDARVERADVERFLSKRADTAFDLVFLDPPYGRGLGFVARCLEMIADGTWVREGGTVVVEAEAGQIDWPPGFRETRTRRFGRTQVSMAVWDGKRSGSDLSGHI